MTKFLQKNAKFYECKSCSFISSNKRNYDVHLTTRKHREMTMNDDNLANLAKMFVCECGNSYKYRQGLFAHKKKCRIIKEDFETAEPTSAIIDLIKQNSDFKELILEQTKTIQEQNKSLLELASKSSTTNNNSIK